MCEKKNEIVKNILCDKNDVVGCNIFSFCLSELETWTTEAWTLIVKLALCGGQSMKKSKQTQMNPNWVQLQQVSTLFFFFFFLLFIYTLKFSLISVWPFLQKLNLNGPKVTRNFNDSDDDIPNSILGKQKIQFFFLGVACLVLKLLSSESYAASNVL
jgi:hypothetical protein